MPFNARSIKPLRSGIMPLLLALVLTACAGPAARYQGPAETTPRLEPGRMIAHDGFALKLHHWPVESPQAVVLALHGFNDYGRSFEVLEKPFNQRGISLYAYDHRGFGGSEPRGYWPGRERMARDAVTALQLLRERYPETPLYLMGMSMGGAVTLMALQHEALPQIDGSVLIAPAVWSRDTMPWYQRFGLWMGNAVAPGMTLSPNMASAVGVRPRASDDRELLQAMSEDPMVQSNARIGTLHGLSNLMDDALSASQQLPVPALILYGDNDQIIPPPPVCRMLQQLPDPEAPPWQMTLYPDGYHMLTRYSGAPTVIDDLLTWLTHGPEAPLPSGYQVSREQALSALCE